MYENLWSDDGEELEQATEEDLSAILQLIMKLEKESAIPIVRNSLRALCKDFIENHLKEPMLWIKSTYELDLEEAEKKDEEYREIWEEDMEEVRENREKRQEIVTKAVCDFVRPKLFWPTREVQGDEEHLEWLCENLGKLPQVIFRKKWKEILVYSCKTDVPMPEKCVEIMKRDTGLKPRTWY